MMFRQIMCVAFCCLLTKNSRANHSADIYNQMKAALIEVYSNPKFESEIIRSKDSIKKYLHALCEFNKVVGNNERMKKRFKVIKKPHGEAIERIITEMGLMNNPEAALGCLLSVRNIMITHNKPRQKDDCIQRVLDVFQDSGSGCSVEMAFLAAISRPNIHKMIKQLYGQSSQ